MKDGVYVPTRKDIKEDFPLRGAVCCSSCQTPLTAGWSKGKYNKYPYYFCRTKGCDAYGKTIARDKIESAFQDVLRDVQLSETLACMAVQLFKDIWDQQAQNAEAVQ
ncbi:MAG: zinc ribbon domain-containing protein [Hyphomicrobiales bacterium]